MLLSCSCSIKDAHEGSEWTASNVKAASMHITQSNCCVIAYWYVWGEH